MGKLGKLWAGRVFGTNTGNLFISLTEDGPHLSGTMRFLDDQFGITLYQIEGEYGETITLHGEPSQAPEGIILGPIDVVASLTSEGSMRGTWESTLGTAGTFNAFPHSEAHQDIASTGVSIPEQIYSQSLELGALVLYPEDIQRLISQVALDFETGRVTVTYNGGGPNVTRYADDFLNSPPNISELSYLKIMIQEPEAHGINKLVSVEISSAGINSILVQGIREAWVIGKAASISTELKRNERKLITTYKKFGLNLNGIIFLAMLIVIPNLSSIKDRTIFVAGVFLLLAFFYWIHSVVTPNASIKLQQRKRFQWWPTVISWLVAVSSALAASILYRWLAGG